MYSDPTELVFKYRRNSDLPRREFVVTTRRCNLNNGAACGEDEVFVLVNVTAPDPVAAVQMVANSLANTLLDGWHWHREPGMVREVTRGWDGSTGYRAPVLKVCEAY